MTALALNKIGNAQSKVRETCCCKLDKLQTNIVGSGCRL